MVALNFSHTLLVSIVNFLVFLYGLLGRIYKKKLRLIIFFHLNHQLLRNLN